MKYYLVLKSNHGNHEYHNRKWEIIDEFYELGEALDLKNKLVEEEEGLYYYKAISIKPFEPYNDYSVFNSFTEPSDGEGIPFEVKKLMKEVKKELKNEWKALRNKEQNDYVF